MNGLFIQICIFTMNEYDQICLKSSNVSLEFVSNYGHNVRPIRDLTLNQAHHDTTAIVSCLRHDALDYAIHNNY